MTKRKKPSTPVPEKVHKYPGKKDKKKWCKGKVGVEHEYEWKYIPWGWSGKELCEWDFKYECKKCGRREFESAFDTLAKSIQSTSSGFPYDPVEAVLGTLNGKFELITLVNHCGKI